MPHPSEKSWQFTQPRDFLDWDILRLQSLAPGGFGIARAYIWPKLLHVHMNPLQIKEIPETQNEPEPHRDERQIRLDTDRSFVLYPVDDGPDDGRVARQAELNNLIVQLFRRHPGLNYFQGFHDIATVLQLTLPPELALPSLEKLSLHRLRDSMGHTLEPLTALMLILQRLLRLADPPYAALLEDHAPLPYAALPHLLTLLAHATPTLPLIQHIFDYLLVRSPLAIVYLVAAITLSRKDLVLKLGEGSDEGMIHSVLTGLPEFTDLDQVQDGVQGNSNPELAEATPEHSNSSSQLNTVGHATPTYKEADSDAGAPIDGPPSESSSPGPPTTGVTTMTLVGGADVLSGSVPSPPPHDEDTSSIPVISGPSVPPSPPRQVIPVSDPSSASTFLDPADIPIPPSVPSTRPASPVSSCPTTACSLSSVLLLADDLLTRFPPDTPELRLTHTLGPASAMRTWAQDASVMPSDEQAEALVVSGVDIVVCEPDPQILKDQKAKKVRKRKVRRREARLLAAGAVLVLGVAVMYGVRARGGRAGGGLGLIGAETEWRALVGVLGAFGDRVLGAFGDAHVEL
ncbi:rab-GTPase-TBC domain-containing protein [Lactarius akahatsu]|uniref:Rab-GTPase-TBC domain-containing protein n=1 Tax=Lactarius akahatsu TaxID=416441 RepID=A0AAD4L8N2_9AGAM|nr:rab-GTPase-TBC domain-containing protein [Lactarius akahatsu]